MVAIPAFFAAHWLTSVFCQTFFLHRYGAHRMFSMSRRWERAFHLLTYLAQGSSYLNPRAYAILHRMHHAFSDTERDPHSPVQHPNVFRLMWITKGKYDDFAYARVAPEPRFDGGYPVWPALDRVGQSWAVRALWIGAYTAFYVAFAPSLWWYLLLPAHFVMGPIHGAIVNYCGHKIGYESFDNGDRSRNTLAFDFVTLGELFQNNHHAFAMSPNFAARRFEIDPVYPVILLFEKLGIVRDVSPQRARLSTAARTSRPEELPDEARAG